MKKLVLSLLIFSMYFVTSAQKINVAKVQKDTLMFSYDKEILLPSEYNAGEFIIMPYSGKTNGISLSIIKIHHSLKIRKLITLKDFLKHVITMEESKPGFAAGPVEKIISRMSANVVILVLGCGKDRIFMEMEVSQWIF
ncbi:hypothetical protein U1E44_00520 [Arenibacter sp. GZD96]|uniref:hypothetical protein n=1 Tax=Aurantibrevibacter litoralis TaxID=3106030 RepID=UPI002B000B23|nr:hypothetical protein [Arenibacter sp. GZD-96]MEA1784562.1 hypothetical protein [Arenibacter sp. GZD-96]